MRYIGRAPGTIPGRVFQYLAIVINIKRANTSITPDLHAGFDCIKH
jgi:hypothetical protein